MFRPSFNFFKLSQASFFYIEGEAISDDRVRQTNVQLTGGLIPGRSISNIHRHLQ